jgi:hypothetical protein
MDCSEPNSSIDTENGKFRYFWITDSGMSPCARMPSGAEPFHQLGGALDDALPQVRGCVRRSCGWLSTAKRERGPAAFLMSA